MLTTCDIEELKRKVSNGCAVSEWRLAEYYLDGYSDSKNNIIIQKNKKKAIKLFRSAAQHGNKYAQNTLGVMLSDGDGVIKNIKEGMYWLKKAYKNGDGCAANNIAILYQELKNYKRSFFWFERAIQEGEKEALVDIGKCYYYGKGVRINYPKAVNCFRKVIKLKNIDEYSKEEAYYCLGITYLEGKGVKLSTLRARRSFERANIDNDHIKAKEMLSLLEKERDKYE